MIEGGVIRFRPLYQNLVVKIDHRPGRTAGGLFLPEIRHPEKYRTGEVVAVGKGRLLRNGNVLPLEVKVGDRIVFNEYMGTKVKTHGYAGNETIYLNMKEDDIWCIYEGDIELNEVFDRN